VSKQSAARKKIDPAVATYISKQDASVTRERKNVVVDRELDRIHEKYGSVTPSRLLEEAQNPKSPLHRYFEWDDSEAAKRYRLAQANAMLQASRMVVVLSDAKKQEPVAAFPEVRRLLPSARGEGKFKMRKEVLEEPDARQEIIERKLGVLRGWCRESIDIDELQEMRSAILAHLPGND
jgi:hypothetical protein